MVNIIDITPITTDESCNQYKIQLLITRSHKLLHSEATHKIPYSIIMLQDTIEMHHELTFLETSMLISNAHGIIKNIDTENDLNDIKRLFGDMVSDMTSNIYRKITHAVVLKSQPESVSTIAISMDLQTRMAKLQVLWVKNLKICSH